MLALTLQRTDVHTEGSESTAPQAVRTMKDSFHEVYIPLTDKPELQLEYLNCLS